MSHFDILSSPSSSKKSQVKLPQKSGAFDFLRKDYLPEVRWNLGGMFRFDHFIGKLSGFVKNLMGSFIPLDRASGSPVCLWSLDWHRPRGLEGPTLFEKRLQDYATAGMGVTVCFDNPYVREDQLSDFVGNTFLKQILERNRLGKNAVSVASERLANHIAREFPQLPVWFGLNGNVAANVKRSADYYNRLAERYQRVAVHPADCRKKGLLNGLEQKEKFELTVNDTCLANCPVRREHMQVLSRIRENPCSAELLREKFRLIREVGCSVINPASTAPSLLATGRELREWHDAGFRHFRIQSESLQNEISFAWECCRLILPDHPELSGKKALIANALMGEWARRGVALPSGMHGFTFTEIE